MRETAEIEKFIADWRDTGGSELANTQSFINGLCRILGVDAPTGSRSDDLHNDYVFERRVFQDNGDGTQSFGRIDCYKRHCFILEAKQGSEADRTAADNRAFTINHTHMRGLVTHVQSCIYRHWSSSFFEAPNG